MKGDIHNDARVGLTHDAMADPLDAVAGVKSGGARFGYVPLWIVHGVEGLADQVLVSAYINHESLGQRMSTSMAHQAMQLVEDIQLGNVRWESSCSGAAQLRFWVSAISRLCGPAGQLIENIGKGGHW